MLPFQYSDLVLQRVLLPLQRLLVDDLDGVHLAVLAALGQPDLGESSPEMKCLVIYSHKILSQDYI